MDPNVRARLRWWLRSEQAFGLPSVATAFGGGSELSDAGQGAAAPSPALDVEEGEAAGVMTPEASPEPPLPVPPARPPVGRPVTAGTLFASPEDPADAGGLLPLDPSTAPFDAPPLSTEEKRQRLTAMNDNEVRGCTKCRLCDTRKNTVFGGGDVDAKVFFIGEGPGENEDLTGRPFVGRAGEMLNKWIAAMGLEREQVYIANIVKCRPPNNRVPAPDEVATCTPYLQRQLEIIRPRVIVTLGLPAAKYMLQSNSTMGRLRGQWQSWRGIKLMPTFHPAYVLRNPSRETRGAVWDDLKKVMAEVGLAVPRRQGGE